jgi:hypothetical protein
MYDMTYLCFLISTKLGEHDSDRFAFRVSDCAQSIPSDGTCDKAREVCDDKSKACTSESTNPGPPRGYALDLGS